MERTPLRILVADDEEPMRQALTFILESAGHTVTPVDDGAYALQQLLMPAAEGDGYDLLLTDLMMPRMPGLDLISLLGQRNISMPVIVISGCSDKQTMIQLIRNGCNDFLEKPFAPEDVLERVSEVMDKWTKAQEKQRERERQLQAKLNDLKNLLSGYEKRFSELLQGAGVGTDQGNSDAGGMDNTQMIAAFPADALQVPENDKAAEAAEESMGRWDSKSIVELTLIADSDEAGTGVPPLVEAVKEGDWLRLTPQEYLSDDYTPEFCKFLVAYLDSGECRFRFDLSRINELGSRVLAVFAAFAAVLQKRGGDAGLEIAVCSAEIAQLFRLTSLHHQYRLPVPVAVCT